MGIVPLDLAKELTMMYAFLSLQAYLAVRTAKLTLAEAIESEYVYFVPRTEVIVATVGGVRACFWDIPF